MRIRQLIRWDGACLLVLCFLILVIFHPWSTRPDSLLVGVQRNGRNDLTEYFLASRDYPRLCRERFAQWPLWNPYSCLGTPFVGNPQSALYYPPNWICFFWGSLHTLSVLLVAHHCVAGMGVYLLCRQSGLTRLASLSGGVAFAGSPYLLAQSAEGHVAQINVVTWIPWAVLAYERVRVGAPVGVPLLAIVLAMCLFAGHAQEAFYLGLVVAGLFAADLAASFRRKLPSAGKRLAREGVFCGLLSVGLVAVELFPVLGVMRESLRGTGFSGFDAGAVAIGAMNCLQCIEPNILGDAETYVGPGLYYWETLFHFGPLTTLVALVGAILGWRRRIARMALGIGVISIPFAFGSSSPVFWLLYWLVPGMSLFRIPGRALFFASFAVSILTAIGIDEMRFSGSAPKTQRVRLVSSLLTIPFGWLTFCLGIGELGLLLADRKLSSQAPNLWEAARLVMLSGSFWSATVVFLLGSMIAIGTPRRSTMVAGVFLMGLVWQASQFSGSVFRALPLESFRSPSLVEKELTDGDDTFSRVLTSQGDLSDFRAWRSGVFKAQGYEPAPLARVVDLFASMSSQPNRVLEAIWYLTPFETGFQRPLLDLLGVRRLVVDSDPKRKADWSTARVLFWGHCEDRPIWIVANESAWPRAFVIPQSIQEDVRREDLKPAPIVEYSANRVVIDVEGLGGGMLVLSDADFPGWSARVDDVSREVGVAFGALRKVPVSAGARKVVFEYWPPGLEVAIAVSAMAWAFAAMCVAREVSRRFRLPRSG